MHDVSSQTKQIRGSSCPFGLGILVGILSIALLSCGAGQNRQAEADATTQRPLVGLAMGDRGVGDQGFNDMQYNGLVEIGRTYDVRISYEVPSGPGYDEVKTILESLIAQGASLIFTGSNSEHDAVVDTAKAHPEVHFVILDSDRVLGSNTTSIVFRQEEAAFLAGYLAARIYPSSTFALIGGVDIPPVLKFLAGFAGGVEHAKQANTLVANILTTAPDYSGFASPDTAYEIARAFYASSGASLIFAAAGGSGLGVVRAVRENPKAMMIGVDADQDHLAKGQILTSVMKRLDSTMIKATGDWLAGKLGSGVQVYDLASGGVGLSAMQYTPHLLNEQLVRDLAALEDDIKQGRVYVPEVLDLPLVPGNAP